MPRRQSDTAMLSCACSRDEREAIDQMKAAAGLGSDADLVRTALWNFSEHLEMDFPMGVFDLRPCVGATGRRGQVPWNKGKKKPKAAKVTKNLAQKQPADHAWRLPLEAM